MGVVTLVAQIVISWVAEVVATERRGICLWCIKWVIRSVIRRS